MSRDTDPFFIVLALVLGPAVLAALAVWYYIIWRAAVYMIGVIP